MSSSNALSAAVGAITGFYGTMWYYLVSGGSFKDCPYYKDRSDIRCQLYAAVWPAVRVLLLCPGSRRPVRCH